MGCECHFMFTDSSWKWKKTVYVRFAIAPLVATLRIQWTFWIAFWHILIVRFRPYTPALTHTHTHTHTHMYNKVRCGNTEDYQLFISKFNNLLSHFTATESLMKAITAFNGSWDLMHREIIWLFIRESFILDSLCVCVCVCVSCNLITHI